jgi:hypothetical protein
MDISSLWDVPLINVTNLSSLLLRLGFDLIVVFTIARLIYFRLHKNRTMLFTLVIFNLIIFLVCYLLSHLTLGLGFSFGIFAIFSILRYRTMSLPIKDMTYLFISISIAVFNSLANQDISFIELLFANVIIIIITFVLEKAWMKNEQYKYIVYEKIELVKPTKREELLIDLKERTGLDITRCEIGKIDFLKDVAEIRIFFEAPEGYDFVRLEEEDDDD